MILNNLWVKVWSDVLGLVWEFPRKMGYPFGAPYYKDYSIWGSILRSPYFGKLPYLGLGFRVWGLGFRDWGLGFGV